ncbi:MAG: SDR family oxidoreductase [Planctomycetota bacterium]|jgi:3-oxoacyl-[acyl-carrier protein] reductase
MNKILDGKRAMVCGSSQGLGRASAVELARLGATVTLLARDEAALRTVAGGLSTETDQHHNFIAVDFSQPESVRSRVAAHIGEVGGVHILVNNTGGPPAGALLDARTEQLTGAFANHLLCNQLLVQMLVPGMKQAGFGRIINIISLSVVQPVMGLGVSNTIRGAVAQWARTLAGELGPFGITVNNVLPGYTNTARLQSLLHGWADRAGIGDEDMAQQLASTIPMLRIGDPEEFGAVVGFLASPAASYVTGVNLPVDGGRTAVQTAV